MSKETSKRLRFLAAGALGTIQLAAVAGVVMGSFALASMMQANRPERITIAAEDAIPAVATHRVELLSARLSVKTTGTVEPTVYVNLVPEVSGIVQSMRPNLAGGSSFEAGETLFQISKTDLGIELRRREADLAAARASLDIERAEAENARREWESFGRGEITDLASRGPQVRAAEAQVLIAEAQVETAELNLTRAGYSLPFSGRVVELNLAPGQKLSAGQSYGRAYEFDRVEVAVSLSPAELRALGTPVGTEAQIELEISGQPVSLFGKVSRVSGEVDRATRLTSLAIALPPGEVQRLGLRPGTFASVTLLGASVTDASRIPNTALQAEDTVWLVEDGTLRAAQNLQVLSRDRGETLVTGLDEGAILALGAIAGAAEGMRVRFVDAPARQSTQAAEARQ